MYVGSFDLKGFGQLFVFFYDSSRCLRTCKRSRGAVWVCKDLEGLVNVLRLVRGIVGKKTDRHESKKYNRNGQGITKE